MADAYGTITVGHSEDFDGDLGAIVEGLNSLNLTNDLSRFILNGEGIELSAGFSEAQYPCLYPMRRRKGAPPCALEQGLEGELEPEDCRAEVCSCYQGDFDDEEEIPLTDLANELAQHFSKGIVYLACCSNEKNRSVDAHYLRICANGEAERIGISHWVGQPASLRMERC